MDKFHIIVYYKYENATIGGFLMEHILNGNGTIRYKEEIVLNGKFYIEGDLKEILNKRQNILYLEIDESLVKQNLSDLPFSPWIFEGKSNDGKKIIANSMALTREKFDIKEQDISLIFGFNITELTIGNVDSFDCLEFLIPNFLIGFDYFPKQGDKQIRNTTSINL